MFLKTGDDKKMDNFVRRSTFPDKIDISLQSKFTSKVKIKVKARTYSYLNQQFFKGSWLMMGLNVESFWCQWALNFRIIVEMIQFFE